MSTCLPIRSSWPRIWSFQGAKPGELSATAPSHGRHGFTKVAVTVQLVAAAAASSPRSGSLRSPPAMATAIMASATSTRTGARQRRVRAVLPAFPIWSPAPRLVGWSRIALSVAGRPGDTIFGPFHLHSAAMTDVGEHPVTAFNTDTASSNRIHDDATARRFGFRGGLVPGVDVYAYL